MQLCVSYHRFEKKPSNFIESRAETHVTDNDHDWVSRDQSKSRSSVVYLKKTSEKPLPTTRLFQDSVITVWMTPTPLLSREPVTYTLSYKLSTRGGPFASSAFLLERLSRHEVGREILLHRCSPTSLRPANNNQHASSVPTYVHTRTHDRFSEERWAFRSKEFSLLQKICIPFFFL